MESEGFRGLLAYKKAFALAKEIFEVSKTFRGEERYGLTDQVRRSSRSVCACVGEAYRKRDYEKYFVSKLSDADSENTETRVHLEIAHSCTYLSTDAWRRLDGLADEVGRLLNYMMQHPEKFLGNSSRGKK